MSTTARLTGFVLALVATFAVAFAAGSQWGPAVGDTRPEQAHETMEEHR